MAHKISCHEQRGNLQFIQKGANKVPKGGKYPRHVDEMTFAQIFLVVICIMEIWSIIWHIRLYTCKVVR